MDQRTLFKHIDRRFHSTLSIVTFECNRSLDYIYRVAYVDSDSKPTDQVTNRHLDQNIQITWTIILSYFWK